MTGWRPRFKDVAVPVGIGIHTESQVPNEGRFVCFPRQFRLTRIGLDAVTRRFERFTRGAKRLCQPAQVSRDERDLGYGDDARALSRFAAARGDIYGALPVPILCLPAWWARRWGRAANSSRTSR